MSNRANKASRIKPGDLVRITNPQIFVRCGYPLCIADVVKTIDQKIIIDCLVRCGVGTFDQIDNLIKHHPYHKMQRAYKEISGGLALAVMISKGFGGSERKIYTKEMEELKGKIIRVDSKRQVVTGDRYSGCGPGYYGDEAEGPSLENQVRHTLVKFWPTFFDLTGRICGGAICRDALEIEKVYTEKVEVTELTKSWIMS